MKNQIELTKVNGEGFASKRSARNAFNAFTKLNSEIMKQQKYTLEFIEIDGQYTVLATPETGLVFTGTSEENVLYRTVTDKKHDRAMSGFDSRPKKQTEEEMKLQQEKEALEGLISTLLERNGDYDTVYEYKDSCQFAKNLYNEIQAVELELEREKTPEEIKEEEDRDRITQKNIKSDADNNAKLIAIAEKENGRTLSDLERALLVL